MYTLKNKDERQQLILNLKTIINILGITKEELFATITKEAKEPSIPVIKAEVVNNGEGSLLEMLKHVQCVDDNGVPVGMVKDLDSDPVVNTSQVNAFDDVNYMDIDDDFVGGFKE